MHNLTKLFLDYKYILKFIKNHTNTRVFCYNNTIKWRPIVNMPIVNSGCSVTYVKKKKKKRIPGGGRYKNAATGVETDIIYQYANRSKSHC